MKSNKLRTITAAVVFVVLCIGLVAGISTGTLSGFGWDTISMLCPLGALSTMIATKTLLPRGVVSLVIAAVVVLIFGRVFCGWVCPVPLFQRIGDFFRSSKNATKCTRKRTRKPLLSPKMKYHANTTALRAPRAKPRGLHLIHATTCLEARCFPPPSSDFPSFASSAQSV